MDARERHIGVPAENIGGSGAVMDVPVEDEHPAQSELADRELGGDGDVANGQNPIA